MRVTAPQSRRIAVANLEGLVRGLEAFGMVAGSPYSFRDDVAGTEGAALGLMDVTADPILIARIELALERLQELKRSGAHR